MEWHVSGGLAVAGHWFPTAALGTKVDFSDNLSIAFTCNTVSAQTLGLGDLLSLAYYASVAEHAGAFG